MSQAESKPVHDVFISYAKEDSSWVEGYLLDALEAAGVDYHDEEAFALGAPRIVEFERAITNSRRTLLILTPAYLAENFTQFVDVLAQSYGLETATWPVIPLILKPVDLPPRIAQLVALDATDPQGWPSALEKLCQTLGTPAPTVAPVPECPYPGMAPFSEADSARFFGREAEVKELIEHLRLHPFLTVIGPSGSGKSSLVFAGLLPKLRVRSAQSTRFGKLEAVEFAANSKDPTWDVKIMRPGAEPLAALHAVLGISPPQQGSGEAEAIKAGGCGKRTLLVVDQFEEIFTVAGAGAGAFQEALLKLIGAPNLYILLTIRADFYADLMSSPLWTAIQAHRFEVTPLDEDGLRQAIVRPAESSGVFIETALVERLLADAAGEPGVLPLVQETLVLLWEHVERRFLPFSAYESQVIARSEYGKSPRTGLQVAMARRADATLAELSPQGQVIARRIFLRLIQFGEGRSDTRRQQPVDALRSTKDDPLLFDGILRCLTESRLLTVSGEAGVADAGDRKVDISHEALISGWPTLQTWINERRETEQTRRRLEGKAAEWGRLGREAGGLLDEIELREAYKWLSSPDAAEMGFSEEVSCLALASREAIDAEQAEKEAIRQRELDQACALAEEQQRRAEAEQQRAETQQRRAEEQSRSARRLRFLSFGLAAFFLLAVGAAIFAVWQESIAQSNAELARQKASTAVAAEATSDYSRIQAVNAQSTAVVEASYRATAQANAETERIEAEVQRAEAERQAELAHSRELAAQAQNMLAQDQPQLSLLLAVEAINVTERIGEVRIPSAEQSLRETLEEVSGLPLQGHQDVVWAVAVSPVDTLYPANPLHPSRRWAASASYDGTVRLWDISSAAASQAEPGQPGEIVSIVLAHADIVQSIDFSPDGLWLVTGCDDGLVRLWDLTRLDPQASPAETPQPIVLAGHTAALRAVLFSPDGRWLTTGSRDRTARLWDVAALLADQKPGAVDPAQFSRVLEGHEATVWRLAYTPNSRWLVTGSSDGTARMWDLAAPEPQAAPRVLTGHSSWITTLAVHPQGRWLATGSADATLRLWDLEAIASITQTQIITTPLVLTGHTDIVWSAAFSPDGRWLASGSADTTARLWDVSLIAASDPPVVPTHSWVLVGHKDVILKLAFTPDSRWLATGSFDNTVRMWDMTGSNPAANPVTLRGHDADVQDLVITNDGRWMITASVDASARLWSLSWDAASPRSSPLVLTAQKGGGVSGATALAVSDDSRWLVTGSASGAAYLWDLSRLGAAPRRLDGLAGEISAAAFSTDTRWLAIAARDGSAWLWDISPLATGPFDLAASINQDHPLGSINALAFSPDGAWLAIAGEDSYVRLWRVDAASQATLEATSPPAPALTLSGHGGAITALAFSPDGRWLASGSADTSARLWDITRPDPSAAPVVLQGHADGLLALAFSPDGRWLATGSRDATARLWDVAGLTQSTGNPPDPAQVSVLLEGHQDWIRTLAFSPDGRWLATGSDDTTAILWDLATVTDTQDAAGLIASARPLSGHDDWVNRLAFSADSRWLATGGNDGKANLWDLRNMAAAPVDAEYPAELERPIVLAETSSSSNPVGPINALAFTPDGHWLITAGEDGLVRLWTLRLSELIDLACQLAGRNFPVSVLSPYLGGDPATAICPPLSGDR